MKSALLAAASLISCCLHAQIQYPTTPSGNDFTFLHGVRVLDPYRWLEDTNNPISKQWIQSQDSVARRFLDGGPEREIIRAKLARLDSAPVAKAPKIQAGRQVWLETIPGQEQAILKSQTGTSPEVELVNPNLMDRGGRFAIDSFSLSPNGKLITYRLRKQGLEEFTLHVMDVESRAILEEVANPSLRWGTDGIAWNPESTGFYYTRDEDVQASAQSKKKMQSVFYHVVGTPSDSDRFIIGRDGFDGWSFSATPVGNEQHLIIRVWQKTGLTRGVIVIPIVNGLADGTKSVFIDRGFSAKSKPIGMRGDKVLLLTNLAAPRNRIVEVDLSKPDPKNWAEVIPEHTAFMEDAVYVGGAFVSTFLEDAASSLVVHGPDESMSKRFVPLPGLGSVSNLATAGDAPQVILSFDSINQPTRFLTVDVKTGTTSLLRDTRVKFDSGKYTVERHFVTTRDGVKVPIFIAKGADLKPTGDAPVFLTAYGGFNVAQPPVYHPRNAIWLELGGIVVIAGVRGGSEYGEEWHRAGMQQKRRNAFNDFVDVAQWLIDNRYTSSKSLCTYGISNGGLLVSAALNDRPDLFGAVVNGFGLADMVRNESAKTLFDWTDEFGSVKDEAAFKYLLSYSPLHQIKTGVKYPPVLVQAAEKDDRVLPWHQYKYLAALQNNDTGPSPKLLAVSFGAGHAYGKSSSVLLDERTDSLVFLVKALAMNLQ